MTRRILLPLLLAVAPLLPVPLHADIKAPAGAGAGPAMHDIVVNAVRGVPVEVELKGVTGGSQAIKFEIVEQPKQGTLGKVQGKHQDRAVVAYTANANAEGERDEFIYTGQLPGSSAARAKVTVNILKVAPRIEVHPRIDAGRIVQGSSVTKDFNLLNKGNAPWSAKIAAPKNWRWKNPEGGNFQVAANGHVRCEMICDGVVPGVSDEVVVFDGEVKVQFIARVVPPFTVDTKEAVLKWKAKDQSRQAVVTLENMGSDPVKVSVEPPPWIKLPPVVDLTPDVKLPLVLAVEGQVGETLRGTLKLTSGKQVVEVKLTAVPGPGVLEMTSAATHGDAFNFGMLNAETVKTAKHKVTVKNAGGAETTLTVEALKTFRFETPPPAEVKLAAGAEFAVTVLPPQDTAGWPSEELVFNAAGSRLELLLVAGLEAKDIPPTAGSEAIRLLIQQKSSGQLSGKSRREVETGAAEAARGITESNGKEDKVIPRINFVDLVKDEGSKITVAWPLPPGGPWDFEILVPSIERNRPGALNKIWVPAPGDVKVTVSGGIGTAEIGNLVDGAPVNFCIRTLAPGGRRSFPGKPITLQYRKVEQPWNWKLWVSIAVVLAFVGFKLMKYWKKPISARVS